MAREGSGRGGSLASPFRRAPFRWFFVSTLAASLGTWGMRVVQDLMALELTGSVSFVGFIVACQFGPTLLLTYAGGRFADSRFAPWGLIASPILISTGAIVLLIAEAGGAVTVEGLVLSALCFGVSTALDIPLRQVTIADIVPRDLLRPAVALGSMSQQGGRLAGPMLAAGLILLGGYQFALWAVTAIMMVAAAAVLRVIPVLRRRNRVVADMTQAPQPVVGLRVALSDPRVRFLLLIAAVSGLFAYNFSVVLVARAAGLTQDAASYYGVLNTLVALGSIGGAVVASRLRYGATGVLWFAIGLGASLVLIGVLPSTFLLGLAAVALGTFSLAYAVGSNVVIQTIVPRQMRGRVLATQTLMLVGTTPIGSPLLGALIDGIGAPAAISAAGVATIVFCLVARLVAPPTAPPDLRAEPR